jgi:single-stranded-DNA-specific exonuclease
LIDSQTLSDSTLAACGGDPFLAVILAGRGLSDPARIRAFLSPAEYSPAPPEALPDLVRASEMLQAAVQAGTRILVWGDFDVDGQTATALLVDGLRRLGGAVDWYVPRRTIEAHGIKVPSLEREINRARPGLLLTCDTGISEFDAIDYARSVGLPVIVTDHHDLAERLPDAEAVINPKRLVPGHPLANLPGVGVAYKLMQRLYTSQGRERDLPRLLDLVALGIVGDVATQIADTRYLLQIGLDRLRQTGRIGLQALLDVAQLAPLHLKAEQIGYQIGPRLNAAGRLGDAALSVELLTTTDRARAVIIAQQLEGLNNERRLQTRQIEAAAEELLVADPSLLNFRALVLYYPTWHAGLVGIVANRLAERYGRPVVMLSGGNGDTGIARGSARSVPGADIHRAIAAQADLLRTFGGHPGAAGLSLETANIDQFRHRLSRTLSETAAVPPTPKLQIEAIVTLDQLTLDLANRIGRLAPFGEGNPPVTLATTGLRLAHSAVIGREQQGHRLVVEDAEGRQQSMLWWGSAREKVPEGRFDVAYTLNVNERQELEAVLVDYREYPETIPQVGTAAIQAQDWRAEADPLARLQAISGPDLIVWAEAYSRKERPDWKRRAELTPARQLAILTAPPDPQTLHRALGVAQPEVVHVFGLPVPIDNLDAFLDRLALAARNVIDHMNGEAPIDVLCGATAGSRQAVGAGLEYLAAQGLLGGVEFPDAETVRLSPKSGAAPDQARMAVHYERLRRAYDEAEAYRRHFRRLPPERLFNP